eukprot:6010721-Prymnesium_polylepis.1
MNVVKTCTLRRPKQGERTNPPPNRLPPERGKKGGCHTVALRPGVPHNSQPCGRRRADRS